MGKYQGEITQLQKDCLKLQDNDTHNQNLIR